MHMSSEIKLGFWQKSAVISSFVLIALATEVVSLDSASTGLIGLKITKVDMVYSLLWLVMLCSVIFSWPSATKDYEALKLSALHIASGLAIEKIIASGIAIYPHYQEKAGDFTFSALPKTGFLRREARILVGTKPDGSGEFGTYDVKVWRLLPELISAYLRAIFVEGRWIIFLPYLAAVTASFISLATNWTGLPYMLIGKIYA